MDTRSIPKQSSRRWGRLKNWPYGIKNVDQNNPISYALNYINLPHEHNQSHVTHIDNYYSYQNTSRKTQIFFYTFFNHFDDKISNHQGKNQKKILRKIFSQKHHSRNAYKDVFLAHTVPGQFIRRTQKLNIRRTLYYYINIV